MHKHKQRRFLHPLIHLLSLSSLLSSSPLQMSLRSSSGLRSLFSSFSKGRLSTSLVHRAGRDVFLPMSVVTLRLRTNSPLFPCSWSYLVSYILRIQPLSPAIPWPPVRCSNIILSRTKDYQDSPYVYDGTWFMDKIVSCPPAEFFFLNLCIFRDPAAVPCSSPVWPAKCPLPAPLPLSRYHYHLQPRIWEWLCST